MGAGIALSALLVLAVGDCRIAWWAAAVTAAVLTADSWCMRAAPSGPESAAPAGDRPTRGTFGLLLAAVFTDDAVFQGLRPYRVGRAGVAEYYAGQPLGMTVEYRLLEVRRAGADSVLRYLAADFSYRDRDTAHLTVGVLAVRTTDGWRLGYYQAGPARRSGQFAGGDAAAAATR